jgi:hypothetical protein
MGERVSGLSDEHAAHARHLIIMQANLMVRNRDRIHYSQGPNRNVGIRQHLSIVRGQYPTTCDCSSTAYWQLWDAMARPYGTRDLVAHNHWLTCYTGSMYKNGKAVVHDANLKVGDLIFYGVQGGGVPEHVATYIGGGKVFSHGGEFGPVLASLDYRSDRRMSRRYI